MGWVLNSKSSAPNLGNLASQVEREMQTARDKMEREYAQKNDDLDAVYKRLTIELETEFNKKLQAYNENRAQEKSYSERVIQHELATLRENQSSLERSLQEANIQIHAYASMISHYKEFVRHEYDEEIKAQSEMLREAHAEIDKKQAEISILRLVRMSKVDESNIISSKNADLADQLTELRASQQQFEKRPTLLESQNSNLV